MKDNSLSIHVVLEHADFIVINKPVGVPMHDPESGIIQLVKAQLGLSQLFLVHRLDTATSGCLLLATNKHSAAKLSQLFSYHQVEKYYVALLGKKPQKKQGSIVGDMINRRSGQRALLRSRDNPAITQFISSSLMPNVRLSLVRPITGKTHQIRVAMKSLGSPILGDDRYGGAQADRLYLHAWHLRFKYDNELIVCYTVPETGNLFASTEFMAWLDNAPAPETLSWPSSAQYGTTHH